MHGQGKNPDGTVSVPIVTNFSFTGPVIGELRIREEYIPTMPGYAFAISYAERWAGGKMSGHDLMVVSLVTDEQFVEYLQHTRPDLFPCLDWICPAPGCGAKWCTDKSHKGEGCAHCDINWRTHNVRPPDKHSPEKCLNWVCPEPDCGTVWCQDRSHDGRECRCCGEDWSIHECYPADMPTGRPRDAVRP